jgi:hypothetical protein
MQHLAPWLGSDQSGAVVLYHHERYYQCEQMLADFQHYVLRRITGQASASSSAGWYRS